MTYDVQSIFAVASVHGDSHDFHQAVSTAHQLSAHLTILVVGAVQPAVVTQYGTAAAINAGEVYESESRKVESHADKLKSELEKSGLAFDIKTSCSQISDLDAIVAEQARFADLSVFPGNRIKESPIMKHALHGALIKSAAPVLLLPHNVDAMSAVKRVLIAWDGGLPACRALRNSMFWLRQADTVRAVAVASGRHDTPLDARLETWFERHNVSAEVELIQSPDVPVSQVLLEQARTFNADLVVMGGYGHSRLRERVFGGTTIEMIERMDVPVLMSH